jgi:hypothetical protein
LRAAFAAGPQGGASYVRVEACGYLCPIPGGGPSDTEAALDPKNDKLPGFLVDLKHVTEAERCLVGADKPIVVKGRLVVRQAPVVGNRTEQVIVAESVALLKPKKKP